ncbi:hypothetical protein [Nostoc sp. FACHB-857]|uniref:Uncharacterized protein n=1 Tax=Nostoc paludosum FACHB-159 TaxID=2692908 RepID=A0ABR8KEC7_9NOSO|nr:hypothetical protein [Nostoc sp. FACHB-857]MBD2681456.1 hypothetical protein [Nostoc sp. FACHB-857]MBD2737914.1 hypothetical protein [Nostoc paludosum FACHB-159]
MLSANKSIKGMRSRLFSHPTPYCDRLLINQGALRFATTHPTLEMRSFLLIISKYL